MRTVQFEYLRPEEILKEQERCSIAYLPVGPLEWHGPAMPFGTDPLAAWEVAKSGQTDGRRGASAGVHRDRAGEKPEALRGCGL